MHVALELLPLIPGLLFPSPSPHRYGILLVTNYGVHECRYVQWCHGAPSLIPVLATAAELLEGDASQEPILEAAKKAADVVWERGLLTKARLKALSHVLILCTNSCFCSAGSVNTQMYPGKTGQGFADDHVCWLYCSVDVGVMRVLYVLR